jgi:hypothetical protein
MSHRKVAYRVSVHHDVRAAIRRIGLDVVALDKVRGMTGPGSRIEVMDDVGHFFMVQKREQTNQLFVHFLRGP